MLELLQPFTPILTHFYIPKPTIYTPASTML